MGQAPTAKRQPVILADAPSHIAQRAGEYTTNEDRVPPSFLLLLPLLLCFLTMALMADRNAEAHLVEDGPSLQEENASLREQVTCLTRQLQVAEAANSDIAARFTQKLQIVEEEKSALEARL